MPHSKDFIPPADADFLSFMNTLLGAFFAHPSDYGLTPADLTPLQTSKDAWANAYTGHEAAKAAAEAAAALKDNNRALLEALVRLIVRAIQANPNVTDEAKAAAGLPRHDKSRTPHPAPTSRPVAEVDTSERLRHTIHFKDPASRRKAKAPDAASCEIWQKIGGAAPSDPSECVFVADDTNSPYLNQFNGADAGKTVHYILRWVSSRKEKGPWSETVSATIPA